MNPEPVTVIDWAATASWIAAAVAVVSTAFTLWLQWWQSPRARWAVEGFTKWQRPDAYNPNFTELVVADLTVINVGDGSAFDVVATWDEDGSLKSARMAGVIAPGESFMLRMHIPPPAWESATLELEYRSAPTRHRTSKEHFRQRRIAEMLGDGLLVRDGSYAGAPHFGPPISEELQKRLTRPDRQTPA